MIDLRTGRWQDTLRDIPAGSVSLIVTDPPYAVLPQKSWDRAPNLAELWDFLWRVLRPDGTAILTAQQPFAADLISSQRDLFRSEWIWHKSAVGGRMNARHAPLCVHEHVLVFARGRTAPNAKEKIRYFPQGLQPCQKRSSRGMGPFNRATNAHYTQTVTGYPRSILHFANDRGAIHDTQKPVDLLRFLIESYSAPGELVCDPFYGSASTAVACLQTGRHFVGAEQDERHAQRAAGRLAHESKDGLRGLVL